MDKFLSGFAKMAIILDVILAILLILVGVLLIWKPAILMNVFRYGIAIICIVGGVVCLVQLLIAFCSRR